MFHVLWPFQEAITPTHNNIHLKAFYVIGLTCNDLMTSCVKALYNNRADGGQRVTRGHKCAVVASEIPAGSLLEKKR